MSGIRDAAELLDKFLVYDSFAGRGEIMHWNSLPQIDLRNSKCNVFFQAMYVYGFLIITYKSDICGLCYYIEYAHMQSFKVIFKIRTLNIF